MSKEKDSFSGSDSEPKEKQLAAQELIHDRIGFVAGVYHRLPERLRSIQTDDFLAIIDAVILNVINTPSVRQRLCDYQPPNDPQEIAETLGRYAAISASNAMTLKRALLNGLAKHLAGELDENKPAEYEAWKAASRCGLCEDFNRTLNLSSYPKARESVDNAMMKIADGHPRNALEWYEKMLWGQSFPTAVLMNWLPLGLWAMSRQDALTMLKYHALPATIRREADSIKDSELQRADKSVLPQLEPKDQRDQNNFSSAVRDLRLFSLARKPIITLKKRGLESQLQIWDMVFKKGHDVPGHW